MLPLFFIHRILGITVVPRDIENSAYAIFFFQGGDKVHYGKCESSVLCIIRKEARKVNLFLTKKNISIKVNEIT